MFGVDFYHNLIKKYITVFGLMFNNINISRQDAEGDEIQKIKVPLSYSGKDKMLARVISDPEIQRPMAITLPRMGFICAGMTPDTDRQLSRINKVVRRGNDANHMKLAYVAAPYNFNFELYIYVKNTEDGTKIVEQILPYFTPDYTASVHLIPELEITQDIPIVIGTTQIEDRYEGSYTQRQALIYTIPFILKGYLYGPVIPKPIIKFVITQSIIGSTTDNDGAQERVAIYPGLDANGDATSNASLTIDPNLIEFDDTYGYIEVHDVQPFPANTYPFDRTDV